MKTTYVGFAVALLLVGCGDDGAPPAIDAGLTDAGDADASGGDAGPGGETHVTATGTITITVPAEGSPTGAECTLTVELDVAEDGTSPWLCGPCDPRLAGTYTATGDADCLEGFADSASGGATMGWDAGGSFYLALGDNRPARPIGTQVRDGDAITVTVDWVAMPPGAEPFTLTGSGSLTVGAGAGAPAAPVVPDGYACGWPRPDGAAYTGDYTAALDETIPDAFLSDACGETVRLHDLLDGEGWTVVVMNGAAPTCPPCNALAAAQAAEVTAIEEALGVQITVVTLLVADFLEPLREPTAAELTAYAEANGIEDPVLADRGWWAAVHCGLLETMGDGCYYPSIFVVKPDGNIVGFRATGWGDVRSTISAEM